MGSIASGVFLGNVSRVCKDVGVCLQGNLEMHWWWV